MSDTVYKKIAAVAGEVAKGGIGKDRKNQQQGYQFRGIDDCLNALSPILAKNGLVVLPKYSDRSVTERITKTGGVLFYVTIRGEYEFVSTEDGSKHVVSTYGEAMDSGDKATNKAMSAALKYALIQTFMIPTEGDNDADATTPPEVKPTKVNPTTEQPADPLANNETFMAQVNKALSDRQFNDQESASAIKWACAQKNISELIKLPTANRKALIDAISAGKLDKCKQQKEAA